MKTEVSTYHNCIYLDILGYKKNIDSQGRLKEPAVIKFWVISIFEPNVFVLID